MRNFPQLSTGAYKIMLCMLVLFLFFNRKASAQIQNHTGKVINETSRLSVPYVSIGIKNKAIGTVSDSLGHYKLSYREAEVSNADSIVFSSVGYETVRMSFDDFLKADKIIALKEIPQMLKTVGINAKSGKIKSYGRWSANLIFFPAMYKTIPKYSDEKGREQALILKVDRDIYLRKLNLRINRRHFAALKLRLNIYDVKDGFPDRSLLNRDLIFDIAGSSAVGMPAVESIDLRNYQIQLKGRKEIAVSLSVVDTQALPGDTSTQAFYIPSFPSPLRSSFYRMKSEALWQKVSNSQLLVGIEASVFKNAKDSESKEESESPQELTDNNAEFSPLLYGNNKGKRIPVSDGEIYYETYGKGQPLILLHGNNESINSFRNQIEPLSAQYKVIAVDTRGHGNSINKEINPYTYTRFADDLFILMDSLGLKKANLLGWSDGGNTAITFALKHPEKINKMVLMGANLFPWPGAIKEEIIQIFEKRKDSLMAYRDTESQNQLRLTKLVLEEPHIQPTELDAIKVPTLIIAGEFDVIKESHTALIHDHIKTSQLNIVPGGDHYLPQKKPELFNKIVLDFLTK